MDGFCFKIQGCFHKALILSSLSKTVVCHNSVIRHALTQPLFLICWNHIHYNVTNSLRRTLKSLLPGKKPFHVFILGVIDLGFVFAFNILQLKCKYVNLLHIKFGEKLFLTFHKVSLAVRYHWIFIHAMFNKYLLWFQQYQWGWKALMGIWNYITTYVGHPLGARG